MWTYCFVLIKNVPDADMENVRNVTKLRLFIYRFYPKVCELHQYQNLNKTASFNCKYNVNNINIFTSCLIRHNKSHRLVCGWDESIGSASWISRECSSCLSLLVNRQFALLAMETKFYLGEDFGHGFTLIIPYPAVVTLSKLGNFTQAW